MRRHAAFVAIVAALTAGADAVDQGPPREWVVRDVIPPRQLEPGTETYQGRVVPTGDPMGIGRVGVSVTGSAKGGVVPLDLGFAYFWGKHPSQEAHVQDWNSRIYFQPYRCYLKTPQSVQVVVADIAHSFLHVGFDVFTGAWNGNVAAFDMTLVWRSTDLNGDGWEDLFYHREVSGLPTVGALDGRTLNVLWERQESFIWGFTIAAKYTEPEGPPDVNGDGVADFISSWPTADPVTGAWEHDVRALSGLDGSVLWQHRGPDFVHATVGNDVNHDGISDVAIAHADLYEVLDGATGMQLWQQDEQVLLSHAPPGYSFHHLELPFTSLRPDGSAYDYFGVMVSDSPTSNDEHRQFAHFDAQTGALLDVLPHPPDLQPWYDDPMIKPNGPTQYMFEVGDVDGDGLDECAWQVPAADFEVPGVQGTPMHIVFLGLRTLWVPEQARAGERATAHVAIPAASGHEVYLALSREFLPQGGWLVDHWDTNLGPGTLQEITSTNRPFTTTLNADGQGRIDFTVPDHPLLPGETLYARAIVLEPGTTDQVKTISSLGVIEVLP